MGRVAAGDPIFAGELTDRLWTPVLATAHLDRPSTTTLAIDPVLQFEARAGVIYEVRIKLWYGALLAADIKTDWEVPSGAVGNRHVDGPGTTANDGSANNIEMRSGVHNFSTVITYSGVRDSQTNLSRAEETGTVDMRSASAGTVGLRWAQAASSATAARRGEFSLLEYKIVG